MIPKDKIQHIITGFIIYIITFVILMFLDLIWIGNVVSRYNLVISFMVVIIASIGKELYDIPRLTKHVEANDILATILGGVFALVIVLGIMVI